MNGFTRLSGRNHPAAGGQSESTAAPLRSLSRRIQPRATARSLGPDGPGELLPAFGPSLSGLDPRRSVHPDDYELRWVRSNGEIKWQGELIFIAAR
jgi:hypothetical protein